MKQSGEKYSVTRLIAGTMLALLLAIAAGCGGGTSGTGTGERSFEGTISNTDGTPVAGASVTIVETGESTVTDADGNYAITSDVSGTSVDILVETDAVSTTVTVPAAEETDTTVQANVTIDPQNPQTVTVSKLQVKAQIVGFCDPFFENRRTIRQANRIANGTTCTVQVQIYGDGNLLERVPFVVQHSKCDGKNWSTIDEQETGFGVHAGVGTAEFKYFNKPDFCVYRIVAPYQVQGLESVIYNIDTFLKQAADAK